MEKEVADVSKNVDRTRLEKRVVVYFELNLQPKLRSDFDYLAIDGKAVDLIDHQATQKEVEFRAHTIYHPVNEVFHRIVAAHPAARIALAISGQAIELLNQYAPTVVESLVELNGSGAVEWIACPYNNSLSALISREVYQHEVIRHRELLYKTFGVEAKTLLASPFFDMSMTASAATMGFERLMLKSDAWPGHAIVYDGSMNISLLSTDRSITDAITNRFGAGKSTLHVDDLIAMINGTPDETVIIGFPYEVFQLHQHAGVHSFFEDFVSRAVRQEMLSLPSDVASADMSAWPHRVEHIDVDATVWQGNDLQREALVAAAELDSATSKLIDDSFRSTWMQLLTADYFLNMSSSAADLSNPCLSRQEVFNNYMSALTTLKHTAENAASRDEDKPAKAIESERQHPTTPVWVLQEQTRYKEVTHPPL